MDDVKHVQPLCKAHVQTRDLGDGTLYIADSALTWQNQQGVGFRLEYPSIQLHAVSRDTNAFPEQCLYLMVEGSVAGEELDSDDSDERDPVAPISELRLVPDDKESLQTMYTALCLAQTLHPDPDNDESDDDDGWVQGGVDGEGYYDEMPGVPDMTPEGQVQLERLEAMLAAPGNVANINNGNANAHQEPEDDEMETEDGGQFEDCE